ncbi:hydrogenase expression/formation protein HypE [Phorcysia thermohydrogeniphila]|uniref:Hydrogenase expression/formation protein HypE n=1 Tax=Phorcysia thermohydrogeniphila TaxID=936138 RepID=A0A4R1GEJ3_9BACT|nr:hydrogenase expression/formation protein HypE [Phorcysia thermohydrogeniphila]TCK06388.1 hydrogenase expression/formation protein HypE [Phorcysia thermohydrogeniphila]
MRIEIGHGSGGRLTRELIEKVFLKHFDTPELKPLQDASCISISAESIAITTDSYVIRPRFFPGGNIGKLSICGTVNDLTVSGAIPKYISVGFILEEGLPLEELEKIVESMAETAKRAGVKIVTGDTKVVESGKCDGIYINTTGVGEVVRELSPQNSEPGDVVIVTGYVGDHGTAISLARENFEIETQIKSDCAPLNSLLTPLFELDGLRWMRDPTRGGLATALIEFSESAGVGVKLYEEKIPIREEVKFISEMIGYDPLYLANEGKAVIIVSKKDAERALEILKSHPLGKDAEIIGEVTEDFKGVRLITSIGGERRLELLEEDPLPRIC